jgi:hypothetical protein
MDNPEKQNKKHNTLCVGHHPTQDEDLHNKKVDEKIPSISMNAPVICLYISVHHIKVHYFLKLS